MLVMRKKKRDHTTIEWIHGKEDNIGVILPFPIQILDEWVSQKGLSNFIDVFWKEEIDEIFMLDLCALFRYWWMDGSILAARYNFLDHPIHHYSEYVFDKSNLRAIITFRQPDIDGKHWRENHIHIVRGEIDGKDNCRILKTNFNKHVALFGPPINGQYKIKRRRSCVSLSSLPYIQNTGLLKNYVIPCPERGKTRSAW